MISSTPAFAELCGIHAGDGWISSYNYEIGYGTATYEAPYFLYVMNLYQECLPLKENIRILWRRAIELRIQSKECQQILQEAGFPRGSKLDHLRIPAFVWSKPEYLRRFLRGVMDTDGHVHWRKSVNRKYLVLTWTTASDAFASDIVRALHVLDLCAHEQTFIPRYKDRIRRRRVHCISISRKSDVVFYLRHIGFKNPRRWEQVLRNKEELLRYNTANLFKQTPEFSTLRARSLAV
ncbi:hypothetical protein HY493_01760 [Candidatus Woesearchaeota archaeon]|nr:hypothetical protein [Candidatus Woesearchaeota archaeon]